MAISPNVPSQARTVFEYGEMFRAERKAVGLIQQQVVDSVKYKRQTIGDLEGGRNVDLMITFIAPVQIETQKNSELDE